MSLAASYVHRCFLSDIPATIERQWRTSANNTCKSPTNSSKYIHQRRLLSKKDASSSATATPNEPVYLRLLGTVVEVLKQEHANNSNDTAVVASEDCASVAVAGAASHTNTIILVLDDGTGSLTQIQTPSAMATRIQVQPGMTLECIVRAMMITGATTSSKQQNNPYYSLLAHQLVVVQDPHAETLRWLELTYRKKACEASVHNSNNNNNINQDTGSQLPTSVQSVEQFGYPCSGNGRISAEELYYIILSDCETEKSNNERAGGSSKRNNNNNNSSKIRGVSLTDLAEGLEVSESLLEGLIEDLQLAGQIYRNEDGNYLPL